MPWSWLSLVVAALTLLFLVRPIALRSSRWGMPRRARMVALAAGVGYGLLGRVLFGLGYAGWNIGGPNWLSKSFAVMSVSFLFLMPVVIGFLHQSASEGVPGTRSWARAFFAPMLPILLMLGLMSLLTIEGTICLAMALPIFLILGGIGGCLGLAARRYTEGKARAGGISMMLALPYVLAPIEQRFAAAVELCRVDTSVRIRAAPSVVWREIKSVRAIDARELPLHAAHVIGLPRPIEATLSHDGVGGVRIARFERGLEFREIVSEWRVERRLSFTISAEPAPRAALDEHVAVGGPYFDVLDGTYELEPLADGSTLLKLASRQRLSTHFNFYARLWTDFIMSDLQSVILEVIRKRCEQMSPRPSDP